MQTTFLFASPSLLSGVARLLDLGARFDSYNGSETSEAADAAALYSDFRMVGQDLQEVMKSFVVDTDPSSNIQSLSEGGRNGLIESGMD